MQLIYRGAESILYIDDFEGEKVLVKERIEKSYRVPQIDKKLRKYRTREEVKLLTAARAVGVPTPRLLHVDEKNYRIVMDFIDGKRVKELLNSSDKKTIEKICIEVGRLIGKLHENGIVHGDLTTSNMILRDDKIFFIDFGLGSFSRRVEDQGTDLRLLLEALKATHFKILNVCWSNIVKGYKKEYRFADKVLERVVEIEKRARYMVR